MANIQGYKKIFLEKIYFEENIPNCKIFESRSDNVIIFGENNIFILNGFTLEIIKKIAINEKKIIDNCYFLKNYYYMYFLIDESDKNEIEVKIIKIDHNYEKILFKIEFSEIGEDNIFYIENSPFTKIVSLQLQFYNFWNLIKIFYQLNELLFYFLFLKIKVIL